MIRSKPILKPFKATGEPFKATVKPREGHFQAAMVLPGFQPSPGTAILVPEMLRPQLIGIIASVLLLQSCSHNRDQAKHAALDRGQQYYQKAGYRDAEIQFRKALQEDPRFGEAQLWLGRAQAHQSDYLPAVETLKQAEALLPGRDEPKIELGNIYLLTYLADPSRSAQLYRQVSGIADDLLARHPDSFDGWRFRAYLATTDNDPARAVDLLEKVNRLKPNEPDIVTTLCQNLLRAGRNGEAEKTALSFIEKRPDYGPLYTMLYEYYLQAKRPADAESILLRKVAANPKESLYRIELARHYARAGKPLDVSKVLDQMLGDQKTFPHADLAAGDFYAEAKDWPEARRFFTEGLTRDPDSKAIYRRRLVRVEMAVGDRAAAMKMLETILKDDPKDAGSRASRASLRMAANDPEQTRLAVAEFKAIVDDAPENAEYRFQYANALRDQGETEAAWTEYRKVVQKQPQYVAPLQALADLSIRSMRVDDALVYADRILAIEPRNVRAGLVRSGALAAKGQYGESRAVLNELAGDHPDLREAQLQLGMLDVAQKHYVDAEARFRRLFQPGTGDVRALEGLVELYRAQNQLDRAVILLKQDLEKEPQAVAVRKLLAQTAAQAGQKQLAIEEFKRVAATQPASSGAALQLGLAYQEGGNLTQAIVELERAKQLAPGDARVFACLGKALDEAGRKSEALTSYRQSLQLDGRNPLVMNNLAWLLGETGGDLKEALALARNAVKQDPNNPSFNGTVRWIYQKQQGLKRSAGH